LNYLKLSDASLNYLKQTDASNTYLKQTDAFLNYLNQTDAINNYLKQTDASLNYLKLIDASNIYLKVADSSSNYLKITEASNTYLKQTDASNIYLKQTDALITGKASLTSNNTFSGYNTFSGALTIYNKNNLGAYPSLINNNSSLNFPMYEYYPISTASGSITITLPGITADNVGTKLYFRIVAGSNNVTFSGSSVIFDSTNIELTTMTGKLLQLVALSNGSGGYAYYQI